MTKSASFFRFVLVVALVDGSIQASVVEHQTALAQAAT